MQAVLASASTSVRTTSHERVVHSSDVQSNQRMKGSDVAASQLRDESKSSSQAYSTHVVYDVVYDVDKQAHRIWLNIVDPQTGQIVYKVPPQAIRDLLDSLSSKCPSYNASM
jgi:uncharacterized FlaG/YvyC family protein